MRARGLATGATIAALALAGCGGDDPAPFKEANKSATTTSAATPSVATGAEDPLAELSTGQRKALASLVTAQAALTERGDAVASAATDADKLVEHADEGFAAASGSSPEVRRLAAALAAFGTTMDSIAADPGQLPQLSAQLQARYAALARKHPSAAAHVLDAKQKVDSIIEWLPGVRRKIEDVASTVKRQSSAVELDADVLGEAIQVGSGSATAALNGVNQAVDVGVTALADAA